MARKIIWSFRARTDLKNILEYLGNHNKSKIYSKKLFKLFTEAVLLLSEYPQIGKLTSDKGVRMKIVRDYSIIYEEKESEIRILTIWDSRQNPEKLKIILNS